MDIVDSLAADISEIKKSTDRVPVLKKSIADLVTFLHTVHGTGNNDDGDTSAGGPADASNGKRLRTETLEKGEEYKASTNRPRPSVAVDR
ncbi:uncharacterized protein FTJAE_14142 [Fusarium tjaetaba]|uniref:Uncharacterized protein n=1 Tax=Fusarium tjaetaba TaxID=1567544 RepID=A0A8H5QB13_9HYPO|nr:uncharacterized protein FTJAE_14142 [Fusarium tjaetaba]KAF5611982.1 hypothetical protein FTJAE_14142 [Fusarium tjaetaba]